jgi:serine/threonine protein kinase
VSAFRACECERAAPTASMKLFNCKVNTDIIDLVVQLEHANIIQVFGRGEMMSKDFGDLCPFIVMELMDGSLALDGGGGDASVMFFLEKCHQHLMGIVGALKYMHGKRVMHRDVKPANVLFHRKDCVVKLADMDSVGVVNERDTCQTRVDSGLYCAPEVKSGSYSFPADIFSFGKLLDFIVNKRETSAGLPGGLSLTAVVNECTLGIKDVSKRPTATELFHWISTGNRKRQ